MSPPSPDPPEGPDDAAFDDLFRAPVDAFVARRDALVKRLRAAGERERATEVKRWRRPTRVVVALNRVGLDEPGVAATAGAADPGD